MKKTKKRSPEAIKSYQEHCVATYTEEFNALAREFAVMMFGASGPYDPSKGPGVYCVHMQDCLRGLQILHVKIAAYHEAINVAKGGMRG